MKLIITLWKFSRPHTIIGSVISIFTLYYIVCAKQETQSLSYLAMALGIGINCNVFIVGINQIADVHIDKINKPYLPIPAGLLSIQQAKMIVSIALLISLGLAIYISAYLFAIIALAATIGWAYSMPPFHLKQHHVKMETLSRKHLSHHLLYPRRLHEAISLLESDLILLLV